MKFTNEDSIQLKCVSKDPKSDVIYKGKQYRFECNADSRVLADRHVAYLEHGQDCWILEALLVAVTSEPGNRYRVYSRKA